MCTLFIQHRRSGCIDHDEFESFVIDLQKHLPEEECNDEIPELCAELKKEDGEPDREAIGAFFDKVDTDMSGLLSLDEVATVMIEDAKKHDK